MRRFALPARRRLAGSILGGIGETREMFDFRETQEMFGLCGGHGILSDVEVIPMQPIDEACTRLSKGDARHRFVIDMATLAK